MHLERVGRLAIQRARRVSQDQDRTGRDQTLHRHLERHRVVSKGSAVRRHGLEGHSRRISYHSDRRSVRKGLDCLIEHGEQT